MSWRDYISRQFDRGVDRLPLEAPGRARRDRLELHAPDPSVGDRPLCGPGRRTGVCRSRSNGSSPTRSPVSRSTRSFGCLDRAFVEELVGVLDTLAQHERKRRTFSVAPTTWTRRISSGGSYSHERCEPGRRSHARRLGNVLRVVLVPSSVLERPRERAGTRVVPRLDRVVSNLADNSNIDRNERLVAALRGLRAAVARVAGPIFFRESRTARSTRAAVSTNNNSGRSGSRPQLILRSGELAARSSSGQRRTRTSAAISSSCFASRASSIAWRRPSAAIGTTKRTARSGSRLRRLVRSRLRRVSASTPVWPRRFPEFLMGAGAPWRRATICSRVDETWSLLDDKDRDASWKRLLRADTRVT